MFFDFAQLQGTETYKLLASTVVPRPIAWVVSSDSQGRLNAAPFSFFNVMSGDPAIISLGIGSRDEAGTPKDSAANILETKQFVINLVTDALARQMNVTAVDFPFGMSELEKAGLATSPSRLVKPPRITDSPVALECELFKTIEVAPGRNILLGRVLAMHLRDEAVLDAERHHVDTPSLELVGRMHGAGWYARTSDLFKIDRIAYKDWKDEG